jgi:hypothetical protein
VEDVHVRLSDAGLADEFVGFLRRAGCVVGPGEVEGHAEGVVLEVRVPYAYDDQQARLEVGLYLGIWETAYPGSSAELLD